MLYFSLNIWRLVFLRNEIGLRLENARQGETGSQIYKKKVVWGDITIIRNICSTISSKGDGEMLESTNSWLASVQRQQTGELNQHQPH